MLRFPIAPTYMAVMPLANGRAQVPQALSGDVVFISRAVKNVSKLSSPAITSALSDLSFVKEAGPFKAGDAVLATIQPRRLGSSTPNPKPTRLDRSSASEGFKLIFKDGALSGRVLEGVVPWCLIGIDPSFASAAKYLLVSNGGNLLLSAHEHMIAAQKNREIIGGIADLTEEERARELEDKKVGLKRKLAGQYFKPRWFEQSGKLYRWLGVKAYKDASLALNRRLWRPLRKKLGMSVSINNEDAQTKTTTAYHIGVRTIDSMRGYEMQARRNEIIHDVLAVGFSPVLIYAMITGSLDASMWWGYLLFIWNLYPIFAQRYNRARVENTIDLKLGRGRFARR